MTARGSERTPESLFGDRAVALQLFWTVRAVIERFGSAEVHTTKSQVAFRRRRGFAYLWLPPAWTRPHPAELVLSIALDRHDTSRRFKQVAHPAARVWMHHLELHAPDDVDAEVIAWLSEAYETAA